VYADVAAVLSAAVRAPNAYIEADQEMARRGGQGVTVTEHALSGSVGDKAQSAGADATGGLRNDPKLNALNQGQGGTLADWLARVRAEQDG
jgi:hypothetical protein